MARDYPLLLSDFKDTYDPALSYLPGSIVELSGSTYRTPVAVPAGVSPPAAPWRLLAGRGPKGDPSTVAGPPGPGYTSRGPHVIGTNYSVNDIVTYGGETFRRTVNAVSNTVPVDGQGWERWAQKGDVPSSRQVIAGAGLTGGGDFAADRTLAAKVEGFARVDRVGGTAINPTYGTDTKITFHRETFDAAEAFDLASSRYVVPVAGVYSIFGSIFVNGLADANVINVYVTKNGSSSQGITVSNTVMAAAGNLTVSGTGFLACAARDTLEMFIRVSGSGGSPGVPASAFSLLTIGYWGAT